METLFASIPSIVKLGLLLTPLAVSFIQYIRTRRKINHNDFRLIYSVTARHVTSIHEIEAKVLRDQINYAKSSIITIEQIVFDSIRKILPNHYEESSFSTNSSIPEMACISNNQVTLEEIIKNAFNFKGVPKFESIFNQTDFTEIQDLEEEVLVKDTSKLIVSQVKQYIRDRYPHEFMLIPIDVVLKQFDNPEVTNKVREVFISAKGYANRSKNKINEIEKKFEEKVNELIQNPKKASTENQ